MDELQMALAKRRARMQQPEQQQQQQEEQQPQETQNPPPSSSPPQGRNSPPAADNDSNSKSPSPPSQTDATSTGDKSNTTPASSNANTNNTLATPETSTKRKSQISDRIRLLQQGLQHLDSGALQGKRRTVSAPQEMETQVVKQQQQQQQDTATHQDSLSQTQQQQESKNARTRSLSESATLEADTTPSPPVKNEKKEQSPTPQQAPQKTPQRTTTQHESHKVPAVKKPDPVVTKSHLPPRASKPNRLPVKNAAVFEKLLQEQQKRHSTGSAAFKYPVGPKPGKRLSTNTGSLTPSPPPKPKIVFSQTAKAASPPPLPTKPTHINTTSMQGAVKSTAAPSKPTITPNSPTVPSQALSPTSPSPKQTLSPSHTKSRSKSFNVGSLASMSPPTLPPKKISLNIQSSYFKKTPQPVPHPLDRDTTVIDQMLQDRITGKIKPPPQHAKPQLYLGGEESKVKPPPTREVFTTMSPLPPQQERPLKHANLSCFTEAQRNELIQSFTVFDSEGRGLLNAQDIALLRESLQVGEQELPQQSLTFGEYVDCMKELLYVEKDHASALKVSLQEVSGQQQQLNLDDMKEYLLNSEDCTVSAEAVEVFFSSLLGSLSSTDGPEISIEEFMQGLEGNVIGA